MNQQQREGSPRRMPDDADIKRMVSALLFDHDQMLMWTAALNEAIDINDRRAIDHALFAISRIKAEVIMTRTRLHVAMLAKDNVR